MIVFTIDGQQFSNIGVISISRNFEVKDYAGGTGVSINGNEMREVLGTYIGYSIKLDAKAMTPQEYETLFDVLTQPIAFHTFIMPYGQTMLEFEGAIYGGVDNLKIMRTDKNYWGNLEIDVKSRSPIFVPEEV